MPPAGMVTGHQHSSPSLSRGTRRSLPTSRKSAMSRNEMTLARRTIDGEICKVSCKPIGRAGFNAVRRFQGDGL